MNLPRKEIADLLMSHQYKVVMAFLESMRPVVPKFNHAGESNIETVKFMLAQQQHHDAIMAYLNPKGNPND